MMVVCEKRECLVGVNKTFGDHFAGIGNMVKKGKFNPVH